MKRLYVLIITRNSRQPSYFNQLRQPWGTGVPCTIGIYALIPKQGLQLATSKCWNWWNYRGTVQKSLIPHSFVCLFSKANMMIHFVFRVPYQIGHIHTWQPLACYLYLHMATTFWHFSMRRHFQWENRGRWWLGLGVFPKITPTQFVSTIYNDMSLFFSRFSTIRNSFWGDFLKIFRISGGKYLWQLAVWGVCPGTAAPVTNLETGSWDALRPWMPV